MSSGILNNKPSDGIKLYEKCFYGRNPDALLHRADVISTKQYAFESLQEKITYKVHKEINLNNILDIFRISNAEFVCL